MFILVVGNICVVSIFSHVVVIEKGYLFSSLASFNNNRKQHTLDSPLITKLSHESKMDARLDLTDAEGM